MKRDEPGGRPICGRPSPSEATLRLALAGTSDGVWEWHVPSGDLRCAGGCYGRLGFHPGSLREWHANIHPEDLPKVEDRLQNHLEAPDRNPYIVKFRLRAPGGGWRWFLSRGRIEEQGPGGRPERMVGVHTDLAALQPDETDASEGRFQAIFHSAGDSIFLVKDGAFYDCNEATLQIFGCTREEILGRSPSELSPEFQPNGELSIEASRKHVELAMREKPQRFEWTHVRLDGTPFEADVTLNRTFLDGHAMVQAIVRDVSERKRAEEARTLLEAQLRQAQKLESIGRLAGGVAHDLNNMLTPVLGYADLLREGFSYGDPRRDHVDQIQGAALRCRALVRQLLAFARRQPLEVRPLDLNAVVRDLQPLLRRTLTEDVRIEARLAPALPPILGDTGQIEQIILNLAVNAQDAMPGGGLLVLESADLALDEAYARSHPEVVPGPYVMLAISDTGTGMDAEVASKIFEPFFTTKGPGQGTGLGLATVHGIVKQHGGSIAVYSEPGMGTTFRIYFPQRGILPQASPSLEPQKIAGSGTVLVVEDQEQVRELVARTLRTQGYVALEARDAAEALRTAGDTPSVDLLLTDVVLPDLNGRELFRRLSAPRPGLRVLYMSGYAADVLSHHGVLKPGVDLLPKPFTLQELCARVRKALHA